MPDERRICGNCGNDPINNPELAKIAPHPCDLCEPIAGSPCNWRPIPERTRDVEMKNDESIQLRTALRAAVKALCEELCAFGGSELDADGLPICSRPCPELKLAYELLRPTQNESAEVTQT